MKKKLQLKTSGDCNKLSQVAPVFAAWAHFEIWAQKFFSFWGFFFRKNVFTQWISNCCRKVLCSKHRENLNDWYVRKHDGRLGTYSACLFRLLVCVPAISVREVFLCWTGDTYMHWCQLEKLNSTTPTEAATVHTSCAYFWWMFSLHTLADEAKIPLLFFSHECFTEM